MKERALIQQMLEALENGTSYLGHMEGYEAAITAAREYLAAPDQSGEDHEAQ